MAPPDFQAFIEKNIATNSARAIWHRPASCIGVQLRGVASACIIEKDSRHDGLIIKTLMIPLRPETVSGRRDARAPSLA